MKYATLYGLLLGSLIYLIITRPKISYAVHLPIMLLWSRSFSMSKGTLFQGLYFPYSSSLKLKTYSDSDWASKPIDRQASYCFFLGDSLVSGVARNKQLLLVLALRQKIGTLLKKI